MAPFTTHPPRSTRSFLPLRDPHEIINILPLPGHLGTRYPFDPANSSLDLHQVGLPLRIEVLLDPRHTQGEVPLLPPLALFDQQPYAFQEALFGHDRGRRRARVGRGDRARPKTFGAYGTPSPDLPDPVSRAIDGLLEHVGTLSARVQELERELDRLARVAPGRYDDEDENADKPTAS